MLLQLFEPHENKFTLSIHLIWIYVYLSKLCSYNVFGSNIFIYSNTLFSLWLFWCWREMQSNIFKKTIAIWIYSIWLPKAKQNKIKSISTILWHDYFFLYINDLFEYDNRTELYSVYKINNSWLLVWLLLMHLIVSSRYPSINMVLKLHRNPNN